MSRLIIRSAETQDAAALLEIYSPYILKTAVSFEIIPPRTEEFADRISEKTKFYPWLLAERDGEILGYAYAGRLGERAAYDRAVETSIYVRSDCRGQGVGKALYAALEKALAMQNIFHLFACIAWSEQEDEYLSHDSVLFHAGVGYRRCGQLHGCGFKFGRSYDTVWMEKLLPGQNGAQPLPFSAVRERFFASIL